VLNGNNLSKHDSGVTVKESDTGETFAVLEGVNNEGLHGLEDDLSGFVGLEGVRGLELLATGFLSDLPVDLLDTASGTTASDKTDGGVSGLALSGNVEGLDLGSEVLDGLEGLVFLVDHDITNTGHVLLVKTLDVHTDVVTGDTLFDLLVVHFHGEDLTSAWGGGGVGGEEEDILVGNNFSLFNTSGQNITDTLDLVDTGDGHAHGSVSLTGRELGKVVKGVNEGDDLELGGGGGVENLLSGPPGHLLGLLDQVVSHPSGDGEDWDGLLDEFLLPSGLDQHVAHFSGNFVETFLLVGTSGVRVHLVHTDDQLLDTEQVEETSVLTGLSLNFTGLVVTLLDGGGEVTVGGDHEETDISLGGSGDHVLDEITVTGGIDDGVVPSVGEELLGGAGDGDTTGTLFLLTVHVESESEGRLSESIGFLLELLHFTLGDTTELEEETSSGGGLS